MKIKFPEPLNSLLGGLETKTITNFYGGPGTGKTTFCLLAALECIKNKGLVTTYIDTEGGFSPERIKQLMSFNSIEPVLKNIDLIEPKTFAEQGKIIRSLRNKETNIIIIDSMSALYRLEFAEQKHLREMNVRVLEANRELSKQLSILSSIARENEIPVIITSHTFKNWETGENEVVGGDVIKYWSKVIVFLEKTGKISERKMTLVKHRYLPEGSSAKFMIIDKGIKPSGFKLF
jgi:DNA repair protein RadB